MKWVLVIHFSLNPASPASFFFKKIELCCDISGDYLLFYSWFYMNFPLFHWNMARIPVATTFLFLWCATRWEVTPSEKFGREVAPPRFFQIREVAPPHFYFWTDFPFSRDDATLVTMVAPHWAAKGIPCAFNLQKAGAREQNARNMRATREKHASISGRRLHSSGTLLLWWDTRKVWMHLECIEVGILLQKHLRSNPISHGHLAPWWA